MTKYVVYSQDTPIYLGKDRHGEPEYAANLVALGTIECNWRERFVRAADMCRNPVLEEVLNEH